MCVSPAPASTSISVGKFIEDLPGLPKLLYFMRALIKILFLKSDCSTYYLGNGVVSKG